MAISTNDIHAFIRKYLLSLSTTEFNTLTKYVSDMTVSNWLNVNKPSLPNAYSFHKIAVFTGAVFYIRADECQYQRKTPTCTPIDRETFVSQRISEYILAAERRPGKRPTNVIKPHVPQLSTILRLLIQFPQTTFVADNNGMRFDGWENYPQLRTYNRNSGKYCLHSESVSTAAPVEPNVGLTNIATPPFPNYSGFITPGGVAICHKTLYSGCCGLPIPNGHAIPCNISVIPHCQLFIN